jgi:hypothetical protein
MLDAPGYAGVVRLFRALLFFKLGFWAGTFASASLLKRALPSLPGIAVGAKTAR